MKRIITFGMVLFVIFGLFTGCSGNKYNARMYSKAKDLMLSSFLEDNRVSGACYPNPDYVEDAEELVDKYLYDETSPKSRTFTITDVETFDSIFQKDKIEVDFSKEVVYLYIFADMSPREYVIDDISIEDEKTTIYFKLTKNNKKDAVRAYQRCLVVIMDKNDTSEVEFIERI